MNEWCLNMSIPKKPLAAIIIIIIVAVASIAALVYYQGNTNPTVNNPIVSITDDSGYTLNLTSYPERIVSLAPANTQILFAVGAGDNVVGVTDYDYYPYDFSAWVAAGNMSSIGGYYNPEIEPIIALNPDLIISSLGSMDVTVQLREQGYNVLYLNPKNLTGIMNAVNLVGAATNHTTQAEAVVADMQNRIDTIVNALASTTSKPKVYVEIYSDPLWSAGQESFINDLIQIAGGQNIFDNKIADYFQVNDHEEIISACPDIIVLSSSMGETLDDYSAVASRTGWESVNAIINNKIYIILGDMINQPAPRQIDALEALAQIIHPEIFGTYTG